MKKFFFAIVFATAALAVHAQSVEKISEIIESPQINYGQAAYLALTYAGEIEETTEDTDALIAAVQKKWLKDGAVTDKAISLGELSALYVNATGIKGGLFCRLTKNSARYSFKELKSKRVLDKNADPAQKVSGQDALSLFNACAKITEGSK
ncbi:MAG: hypothetical protein IK015_01955 [Treponema sp.]|nr:hypothetical protein [Treponema sp.]